MLTSDDIAVAARTLIAMRAGGPVHGALPASCRPTTLDEAHAIEDMTAVLLGDAIAGWKVGATPDGRVARGALLRSRLVPSGAVLPAQRMPLLGIEAEIAFRLDRDLPPRSHEYAYADVAAAVTALPAIEVVDSRFGNYPDAPFLDRVADCMSNGAFVHGPAQAHWRDVDLSTIDVELAIGGRSVVRRNGGHPTKDPLLPAVALANDLRHGPGIAAGRIVTTGTYTGLHFARPGQAVVVTFAGIGSVEVRFDGTA